MAIDTAYQADAEAILVRRFDLGADLWTTPDRRLLKGSPFSTVGSAMLLLELGMPPTDPLLLGVAELLFSVWKEDGRFRMSPQGGIYPCHTIIAANTLCALGYADDPRLRKTFGHLLATRYADGGWRCNKFSFGRGPETECSNPGPTLTALNAFRYTGVQDQTAELEPAVEFLLSHWTVRRPLGPCHYGIGTLFMQPEYPFGNYNLFVYVHTLSFYRQARRDSRFQEALAALRASLRNGQIIVERVNPKLAGFAFCKKGEPSAPATARYREILANMAD